MARSVSSPRRAVIAALLLVACTACGERSAGPALDKSASVVPAPVEPAAAVQPPFDSVTMDPPADATHPASMDGLVLPVAGTTVNGLIYRAAGAGPHPTLLLLHGFPGNELNHDLAHAVRRAGWNAVAFHYRGSWGSGGEFSLHHVLEDAAAVLDAIREPEFAVKHRIDPDRVSVYGHSMGGFTALMTGAARTELRCTVSVAGANFAAMLPLLADGAGAQQIAATYTAWGTGPIANISGENMVKELLESAADFDLLPRMAALGTRPVLLVAGEKDVVTPPTASHEPVLAALRASGATKTEELRLDDDHAFSNSRIALARALIGFLDGNCR